ncbi:MAG: DUF2946 family protein [Burkholderiales bacterium]|nr:DUF2946 family protein [Burkholderiales bacterium]
MVSRSSLVDTARLLLVVLVLAMGATFVAPVMAWQLASAQGGVDEVCRSAMSAPADTDVAQSGAHPGAHGSHSHTSCALCSLATYMAPPPATPVVARASVDLPSAESVEPTCLPLEALRQQARAPPR